MNIHSTRRAIHACVRRAGTSFTGLVVCCAGLWLLLFSPLGQNVEEGVEARVAPASEAELVRGVTISCQTWGKEWGSEGFRRELLDLRGLGANWIAIHPYARIDGSGKVSWRDMDSEEAPRWLTGPIADAHDLGMQLMVKPHLAYWGSPFSWRGAIEFSEPEARTRFWKDYRRWILELARATTGADAFVVGTELDLLLGDESQWRALIADVREVTDAKLTYAANWTDFERVPFWDALDAIGVQAYFPLVVLPPESGAGDGSDLAEAPSVPARGALPDVETLRAGWTRALRPLRSIHNQTGKPVIFTELGYDCSLLAALEPWKDEGAPREVRAEAEVLQERCYNLALEVLAEEQAWLRGAFLWKWFVGEPWRGDTSFYVDRAPLRAIMRSHWVR
ncbi:MAG: hypothetical protein ACI8QS_000867 [Planctomycetota bacterium]|jgi:hypothetical protein